MVPGGQQALTSNLTLQVSCRPRTPSGVRRALRTMIASASGRLLNGALQQVAAQRSRTWLAGRTAAAAPLDSRQPPRRCQELEAA